VDIAAGRIVAVKPLAARAAHPTVRLLRRQQFAAFPHRVFLGGQIPLIAPRLKIGLGAVPAKSLSRKMQQGCPTSSPSALAWHDEIIDNREDEQCQQKPVEYRFPFALEKLVCVHFPFAFSPRCENELRTAEYSVRPSLPFWRHFPFAFYVAF
jgi:hypothetical protein